MHTLLTTVKIAAPMNDRKICIAISLSVSGALHVQKLIYLSVILGMVASSFLQELHAGCCHHVTKSGVLKCVSCSSGRLVTIFNL
jgi:hypothetical protein